MTDTIFPQDGTRRLDQQAHAALARATASLSPASAALAFLDWSAHLASSPGRQVELFALALHHAEEFARYVRESALAGGARCCVEPPENDRRFAAPVWRQWPFGPLHQAFLLTERWWAAATSDLDGVSDHHAKVVAFAARQWLDLFSPGNFPATNPQVLERAWHEGGANFVRGGWNWIDDVRRLLRGAGPRGSEQFLVGRDVAVTPGKVVLRNRLVELIQYSPTTDQVRPEPVLIVPAWIMKYYILDLSPHDSLIRHLVGQGHTVFCLSWKNPGAAERDLGMQDYLDLGLHAAIDAVNTIVPGHRIHAAGYCLGGTLLAIGAAAMARDGDDRLASLTLFAAQVDFTEPGELALFIDESEIAYLEAAMADKGYLTAQQMAGAFQMLRSYDLLWSRLVGDYLMGESAPPSDLMAWNADATRMPARMHSQYLRRLFLDNDLAEGRYPVGGRPVALSDIRLPMFCVGTTTDHVAPWRSVYKLHHETVAEITFVLTSGGHNAGIVSEPGHPHRSYRILTRAADAPYEAPEEWLGHAQAKDGSWWPAWCAWLDARSGAPTAPPAMGAQGYAAIDDAPGRYVLET
ncbi:MAG: poly-beta-hydroxybutyrate polymerase [Rhodanobacter denitrificans]|uniref:Poly-beta-hydroxybutyrate polymerase n=1 Tax=Rhodanobacter denitrificans TaxID=666685 RepID=A0A2W5K574_9GAMM|nr:MAG: poly-beta-hydroxybutyrate polymerase [Rhodanobacter denitrificans]